MLLYEALTHMNHVHHVPIASLEIAVDAQQVMCLTRGGVRKMLHTLLKWVWRALDTAGFVRVGCPEIGLVSSAHGFSPIQTPAKLWL